jgi:hypothetical protein
MPESLAILTKGSAYLSSGQQLLVVPRAGAAERPTSTTAVAWWAVRRLAWDFTAGLYCGTAWPDTDLLRKTFRLPANASTVKAAVTG